MCKNLLQLIQQLLGACLLAVAISQPSFSAEPSIGGFVPFLGMGMTNEFKTFDDINLGPTFFIADAENSLVLEPMKSQLGRNGVPFYDIALLDTGAATHIITPQAYNGFNMGPTGFGLNGTNTQEVGGATGTLTMTINDAAGVYVAGLGDRTSAGSSLVMNKNALRGQSSFATLTAPQEWTLPNIIGLPMAMQHTMVIRNDQPQVFELGGRTVRTPQIDLVDVGTGGDLGIQRRAALNIRPGIGFVQGPFYVYNLDIEDIFTGGGTFALHDNPASPTVVQDQTGTGGSLFLDVDLQRNGILKEEREFLFDTGADITVISQHMAKRLGFDAVLDTPDFFLEVEGSGGVAGGVPGIYLDELNIVTVGGDFTLQHVPVAILDVTDVSDPGNVLDGIIGMHLFNGRNLVIDAKPSLGAGGPGPSLYISDPVTETHSWSATSPGGEWNAASSWSSPGAPNILWDAQIHNVTGDFQKAIVENDVTVFRMTVGSANSSTISVQIQSGTTLTTFGETRIETGGQVYLNGGKLDAQFVNILGGSILGGGKIFVGTGPVTGAVRNLSGRIAPNGRHGEAGSITIIGDLANGVEGTLAFDLYGSAAVSQYDQIDVDRFAFLAGKLEVTLLDILGVPSAPEVGDMFTLLTAGEGVSGMFDEVMLPGGYAWDIAYNANSVVLSVTALLQDLPGDFNFDNTVDAADYTVWRDGLGDRYTAADYTLWKNNFGQTQAAAASGAVNSAVPEPTAAVLLAGLALFVGCRFFAAR